MSVLALRGIPHSIERTLGWLHVTAGRSDRWMKWGVFATCAQFIALFCGLPFGPMGVAVAFVVVMFVLFVPAIAYAGQPFDIDAMDVIAIIWRPMVASLAAAGACFFLRWVVLADVPAFSRAVLLGAAYALAYLALVVGVLRMRAPLRTMQSLVRGYLPPRFAYLAN